jgi:uncharacterized protein YqgC (DUF456 family)
MLGQTLWRLARLTLGATLLGLGVVGLFLPFLQGILFIVLGLTVLSRESSRARRLLGWVKERTNWDAAKAGENVEGARDGRGEGPVGG